MTHPQSLLGNIAWSCKRQAYADPAAFGAAVQEYQDEIMAGRSSWAPDQVVLRAASVEVQFRCWNQEGTDQPEETLAADDGQSFTMLELMHKVCDGLGRRLLERDYYLYDHCFFEGLALAEQTPRYHVNFGS